MKLTLETQQAEMRSSFSEVHIRIDNLCELLDLHRKETAMNFRQIDLRFDNLESRFGKLENRFDNLECRFDKLENRFSKLECRFDKLENRFDKLESRFDKLPSEIATILSPFFINIEKMLENHELRICALEQA